MLGAHKTCWLCFGLNDTGRPPRRSIVRWGIFEWKWRRYPAWYCWRWRRRQNADAIVFQPDRYGPSQISMCNSEQSIRPCHWFAFGYYINRTGNCRWGQKDGDNNSQAAPHTMNSRGKYPSRLPTYFPDATEVTKVYNTVHHSGKVLRRKSWNRTRTMWKQWLSKLYCFENAWWERMCQS